MKPVRVQTWQARPLLPEAPAPPLAGVNREEHGVSGNLCLEGPAWLGVLGIHDDLELLVGLLVEPALRPLYELEIGWVAPVPGWFGV